MKREMNLQIRSKNLAAVLVLSLGNSVTLTKLFHSGPQGPCLQNEEFQLQNTHKFLWYFYNF